jgi:hypothetical protein
MGDGADLRYLPSKRTLMGLTATCEKALAKAKVHGGWLLEPLLPEPAASALDSVPSAGLGQQPATLRAGALPFRRGYLISFHGHYRIVASAGGGGVPRCFTSSSRQVQDAHRCYVAASRFRRGTGRCHRTTDTGPACPSRVPFHKSRRLPAARPRRVGSAGAAGP